MLSRLRALRLILSILYRCLDQTCFVSRYVVLYHLRCRALTLCKRAVPTRELLCRPRLAEEET